MNDQLNMRMEDIYPDIDKADDMTGSAVDKAPNQKGICIIIWPTENYGDLMHPIYQIKKADIITALVAKFPSHLWFFLKFEFFNEEFNNW